MDSRKKVFRWTWYVEYKGDNISGRICITPANKQKPSISAQKSYKWVASNKVYRRPEQAQDEAEMIYQREFIVIIEEE